MTEPRSFQLTLSRLRLNIVEWGDPAAPPLILQHGGRDHARSWDFVAQAFAGSHRIIAPDLRGHGDSDWSSDGCYELMDLVEDFTGIVRALDLPPCPIIGHSYGGNVVTRFAGLYPDRVTRLINIEGLGDSPETLRRKSLEDPLGQLRAWIDRRERATGKVRRPYPDRATLAARIAKANPRLPAGFADHLASHAARIDADGALQLRHDFAFRGNSPVDVTPEVKIAMWQAITCPVLLVYGAESWASNPAADGRASHFRDARVELFEDAGHWVHHDRRDDFIAMARDFIA